MKRLLSAIAVVLGYLMFFSPGANAAGTITLTTCEFPPYMTQDLPSGGVAIAIAKEAFKRAGYTLQVNFRPWARAMDEAKSGAADGIAGVWDSPERHQWFIYSKPELSNQLGFFKRAADTISYTSLSDLKSHTVGIVTGYANPPAFTAANLKTEASLDDQTNLLKLGAGHVDLVLVERGVANYLIARKVPQLTGQVVWMGPAIQKDPVYVAISKKTPDAAKKVAAFNQGLSSMESDGTLAKMLKDANI